MRLLNTAKWAEQRAKGFRHFVFITGVFRVGIPVVGMVVLADWWLFSRDAFLSALPGLQRHIAWLSIGLLTLAGPVFGIIWGVLTWKTNEWLYRRYASSPTARGVA